MSTRIRRCGLVVAIGIALIPFLTIQAKEPETTKPKLEQFTGKVVPLAELVPKLGTKLDRDAAPHWLALVTEDGKTYPLIKDDGSRLFFKDKNLLKRPMRIRGRFLPGSQLLQVVQVHSLVKGRLHEMYYWCDICSIKRPEKMLCDCCNGPMIFFEVPVGGR